ncbi:MAG TPA: hypothetical protein VHW24_09565, partial [Bryobacteraceae bacterium]|nr:hypothetical protein [Bryobacteraceae bacterium]
MSFDADARHALVTPESFREKFCDRRSFENMQRFSEKKIQFAAVLLVFTQATVCYASVAKSHSGEGVLPSIALTGHDVQKGPNVPPDPWDWRAS